MEILNVIALIQTPLWRDVLEGLRARIGRTALAACAIAIGACMLTLLLGVLSGLQSHADKLLQALGANTIALVSNVKNETSPERISLQDAKLLSDNLQHVQLSTVRRDLVNLEGRDRKLNLVSADQNLASVRGWNIIHGRFLDRGDVIYGQRHMVVTRNLSETWGWHVGDIVAIHQIPFVIVGVVNTPLLQTNSDVGINNIVVKNFTAFIPKSVAPDWLSDKSSPATSVNIIYMHMSDMNAVDSVISDASDLLKQVHVSNQDVTWVTPVSLLAGLRHLRELVTVVAGGITLLAIVLGSITLTTLMVANVRDRVTEIGLRRAIGALPADIAGLFIAESLVLTLIPTSIGEFIALFVSWRGWHMSLPIDLGWQDFAGPLVIGAVLGIITAWWPASLAVHIEPAQALRQQ